MKLEKANPKDLYFTPDHEWVNLQGTVAYVGVCLFKLTGFKEIHEINIVARPGFLKKGEELVTIVYRDYKIAVHMPVDGKLLQISEDLSGAAKGTLLTADEGTAWIASIIPSMPYERNGLLLAKQYQMNGKNKYAKQ